MLIYLITHKFTERLAFDGISCSNSEDASG